MKKLTYFLVVAGILTMVSGSGFAQQQSTQSDLTDYVPKVDGLETEDEPLIADDLEGLFAAVNGGAEVYIQYGFRRALFQTFKTKNNNYIDFELLEMNGDEAAKRLYEKKTQGGVKKIDLGDEAVSGGYYIMLRIGRFYAAVSGPASEEEIESRLIEFTRAFEMKIRE